MHDDIPLEPFRRKILALKCEKQHVLDEDGEVLVFLSPNTKEDCLWGQIIKVSPDCINYSQDDIGAFISVPLWEPGFDVVKPDKYSEDIIWIIDERLVEDENSELKPFVLVEDDYGEDI